MKEKRIIITYLPGSKFQEKIIDTTFSTVLEALRSHYLASHRRNKININYIEEREKK